MTDGVFLRLAFPIHRPLPILLVLCFVGSGRWPLYVETTPLPYASCVVPGFSQTW